MRWTVDVPEFIDSHHHLWDLTNSSYPWLQQDPPLVLLCGSVAGISRNYLLDDFIADVDGLPIAGSVHVEAGRVDLPSGLTETDWVRSQSRDGVASRQVAKVDLSSPSVAELLDAEVSRSTVVGVRDIAAWHPDPTISQVTRDDLLRDPNWLAGLSQVAERDLVFDLQIFPGQVDDATSAIGRNPDLTFAIEHSLLPTDPTPSGVEAWRHAVRRVAELPNTYMKITGLGMCLRGASPALWKAHIEFILERFGVERSMLGSNYPVDGLFATYRQIWDTFDDCTSLLAGHERDRLFRGTAELVYRLDTHSGAGTR
jgi:predicted TIM-barrel fold metal-dependent hydrolase